MKVKYTTGQRARAKAEGKKLCAIDTPHVSFYGPCTDDEHREIVRFLNDFLTERYKRLQIERLHAEQEVKADA